MHAYLTSSAHWETYACIHTYMCTYTHTSSPLQIGKTIHTCIQTYIHSYIHVNIHADFEPSPYYINVCMNTYIHTHNHTYMCAYTQTSSPLHIGQNMRRLLNTYGCMGKAYIINTYIYMYIHADFRSSPYWSKHTYIHAYIHIHTYIHTYIYIYIYMHTRRLRVPSILVKTCDAYSIRMGCMMV
jgi:hypothetical protein